jgi:competence protein ComEA
MFDLTPQERKVVLFLLSVALAGIGINFAVKISPAASSIVKSENVARININYATVDDLINSRVITPKLAQKIIEYRDSGGLLDDMDKLKEIKGIGEKRLEKLKEVFFIE